MAHNLNTETDQVGISRDKIYPLSVFCEVSRLGKHAVAQLRRQGLKTIKCGNRVFVRGEDFDAFLVKQTASTVSGASLRTAFLE
jgi:hypothetical protein